MTINEKAAPSGKGSGPEANQTEQTKYTPSAECGKWAAIDLYCRGIIPLYSCEHLFARNPQWRSA